jgi:hypothetical protein
MLNFPTEITESCRADFYSPNLNRVEIIWNLMHMLKGPVTTTEATMRVAMMHIWDTSEVTNPMINQSGCAVDNAFLKEG